MNLSRDVLVLDSNRPICDLGLEVLALCAVSVVGLPKGKSLTKTFKGALEVYVERTGKVGVVGCFAGEQFEARYADVLGNDITVKFLARVQRLQQASSLRFNRQNGGAGFTLV